MIESGQITCPHQNLSGTGKSLQILDLFFVVVDRVAGLFRHACLWAKPEQEAISGLVLKLCSNRKMIQFAVAAVALAKKVHTFCGAYSSNPFPFGQKSCSIEEFLWCLKVFQRCEWIEEVPGARAIFQAQTEPKPPFAPFTPCCGWMLHGDTNNSFIIEKSTLFVLASPVTSKSAAHYAL